MTSQNPRDGAEAAGLDPLALSVANTAWALDSSPKTVTRLIADGKLDAVKSGAKTLVLTPSMRRYLASLPPAKFVGRKATNPGEGCEAPRAKLASRKTINQVLERTVPLTKIQIRGAA